MGLAEVASRRVYRNAIGRDLFGRRGSDTFLKSWLSVKGDVFGNDARA